MPFRKCVNPFNKHGFRFKNTTLAPAAIVTKWYPIVKKGDFLCVTCKRSCYKKNKNQHHKVHHATSTELYHRTEYQELNQGEILFNDEGRFCSDQLSNSSPKSDDGSESDDEYLKLLILPKLNELLSMLNIEQITGVDLEITNHLEVTINKLASQLKSVFINKYFMPCNNNFESELLQDLRNKFNILSCVPNKCGILAYPLPRTRKTVINEDLKNKIELFYRDDEISRNCPGQRDYVIVRNGNSKIKIQKKLLMHNLREVYALFKSQYPNESISFSKFCTLRPPECVLVDNLTGAHNVCVCMYHQNIKIMLEGSKISKLVEKNDYETPITYKDVIKQILCETPTDKCFYQICKNCPGFDGVREKLKSVFDLHSINTIFYKEWKSINMNGNQSRYQLISTECSALEFLNELEQKFMNKFLEHYFVAKSQSDYIKTRRQNLNENEVMVLMDFSENYTCTVQDEIQAHHWYQKQVTIHPYAIYKKHRGNEIREESFVVISEDLHHDVYAVALFQQKLINYLKDKYQNAINKIIYVSDGASGQYKNKSNFLNLVLHYKRFCIEAEWHFFATSHGKSACDGIGGTLKRLARRASLQNKCIRDAEELYIWAHSTLRNITFSFCRENDHEEVKQHLQHI